MIIGRVSAPIDSIKKVFMDKDSMDASIGLQFSIELLKKYRKNGLFQAFVSRVPGISGNCHVEVTVLQGVVTSCRARNQEGNIYNVDINLLLKLDKIRGPFEWKLVPLAQGEKSAVSTTEPPSSSLSGRSTGAHPILGRTTRPLSPSLSERESASGVRPIGGRTTQPLSPSLLEQFAQNKQQVNQSPNSLIPRVKATLNFNQSSSWTPTQKHALVTIYSLIDGNRSIADIKQAVAFPPQLVEEVLQVLVWIGVITLSSNYNP